MDYFWIHRTRPLFQTFSRWSCYSDSPLIKLVILQNLDLSAYIFFVPLNQKNLNLAVLIRVKLKHTQDMKQEAISTLNEVIRKTMAAAGLCWSRAISLPQRQWTPSASFVLWVMVILQFWMHYKIQKFHAAILFLFFQKKPGQANGCDTDG